MDLIIDLEISLMGVYKIVFWINSPLEITLENAPWAVNCSNHPWSEYFNKWWPIFIGVPIIGCVDSTTKNHIIHDA
jgi:hypothetical protein